MRSILTAGPNSATTSNLRPVNMTTPSGNMRIERIAEVAATGVDYISSGARTHSAQTLDLGMNFWKKNSADVRPVVSPNRRHLVLPSDNVNQTAERNRPLRQS